MMTACEAEKWPVSLNCHSSFFAGLAMEKPPSLRYLRLGTSCSASWTKRALMAIFPTVDLPDAVVIPRLPGPCSGILFRPLKARTLDDADGDEVACRIRGIRLDEDADARVIARCQKSLSGGDAVGVRD